MFNGTVNSERSKGKKDRVHLEGVGMEEHIQASGGASGPSQTQVVADNNTLYCRLAFRDSCSFSRGTRGSKRTMCATSTASLASFTSYSMNGPGGTIDIWFLSKNDPTSESRFEMERSQWEVEKAELQARIAFLQGKHCSSKISTVLLKTLNSWS